MIPEFLNGLNNSKKEINYARPPIGNIGLISDDGLKHMSAHFEDYLSRLHRVLSDMTKEKGYSVNLVYDKKNKSVSCMVSKGIFGLKKVAESSITTGWNGETGTYVYLDVIANDPRIDVSELGKRLSNEFKEEIKKGRILEQKVIDFHPEFVVRVNDKYYHKFV